MCNIAVCLSKPFRLTCKDRVRNAVETAEKYSLKKFFAGGLVILRTDYGFEVLHKSRHVGRVIVVKN